MTIGDLIRKASREFDRDQQRLAGEWENLRHKLRDGVIYDCPGDDCVFDEDGFHCCGYVPMGEEPPTMWEEMIVRL